ncbi:MAG: hypothetical protein H7Z14_06355 [Anaerolineae bacterium]|nr:hypothetical protein [Phycisphaerae bacterium]
MQRGARRRVLHTAEVPVDGHSFLLSERAEIVPMRVVPRQKDSGFQPAPAKSYEVFGAAPITSDVPESIHGGEGAFSHEDRDLSEMRREESRR